MRKIFALLLFTVLFAAACDNRTTADAAEPAAKTDEVLADNKIYFFYYNECRFCHQAMDYINAKYPTLDMTMINIHNPGGYELLIKCAEKFNLGRSVGTPLFCMDDKYLMGWSEDESPRLFDEYVQPYLK